jgi:RNA polymerase sigma-70 factor (ECF subfamily)
MEIVDLRAASDTSGVADLVSRIMDGDQQAEAELVERYSRGVAFIIRRETGGASAADDLYQETFRIALEKIRRGDLREPEKLSGFVCGIAHNLVIDYFRRAARQDGLIEIEEAASLPLKAPSQLDELLQKEKAALVRQVINELPSDRDRQILFRFYIAEEEKESICADLGLTGVHFNRVLHRARERYRELYEKAIGKR